MQNKLSIFLLFLTLKNFLSVEETLVDDFLAVWTELEDDVELFFLTEVVNAVFVVLILDMYDDVEIIIVEIIDDV